MAYYKDLMEYNYTDLKYTPVGKNKKPICVGWLGYEAEYAKGEVPAIIKNRLLLLCLFPRNLTRGYHTCEFCPQKPYPEEVRQQSDKIFGRFVFLGNGEIHIPGKNNVLYISPTLISHYIAVHNYKPPQEFIDVLSSYSSPSFAIFSIWYFLKDFFYLVYLAQRSF